MSGKMAESAHRENMLSAVRAGRKGTNTDRGYLQGLLAGTVAVAEVTGKIKIADMTDQTWKVVNEIHERLLAMATAEAGRLDHHSEEPMKTGTEIIAREIALFHGSAMIVGNQTIAATRGYSSWGHSPEKYADDHWREYIGAAEAMLARINGIHADDAVTNGDRGSAA